jgi:hypothetical protein
MWLISKALYESLHCSQEQEVESLEESSSDGKPSVQLSGIHTQLAYLPPDKMTAFSRLSRFGMTFKPLTADRGEELLMSYREAFPARTSPQQEKAQESTGSEAVCGNTWRGWLAKLDPDSSLWRTAQCSFLEEEPESLQTLPRSGMTRGGLLWELPMSERRTKETGFGFWPTPKASDDKKARGNPFKNAQDTIRRGFSLSLPEAIAINKWPTPRSCSAMASTITPESAWAENRFPNLETIVGRSVFPTPTRRDFKSGTGAQPREGHSPPLSNVVGGTLNPNWTEWLMGWPLGWTDLKPLGMDKSPCVPQKHGEN